MLFEEEYNYTPIEKTEEPETVDAEYKEPAHEERPQYSQMNINGGRQASKQNTPRWGGIIALALVFSVLFGGLSGFLGYRLADNKSGTVVIQQPVPETPINQQMFYDGVVDVVNKVSPAVVSITVDKLVEDTSSILQFDNPFEQFFNNDNSTNPFARQQPQVRVEQAAGSGVIIKNIWTDEQGFILTNNHVVENGQKIVVHLIDKRNFEAQIVATDSLSDLAILKVKEKNLPMAELGDSSKLKVGQPVVAIGNPYKFENTVTTGVISALARNIQVDKSRMLVGVVQTDAAINPGNSGGPLVTLDGKVVGINTVIIEGAQNLGFAVSSNVASRVAKDLIKFGKVGWPVLGVRGATLTQDLSSQLGLKYSSGAYIAVVEKGGAQEAGIQRGDIVTAIDGKEVADFEGLLVEVRNHQVGDVVKIRVSRDGREMTFNVKLGAAAE
ncbi:MAG TPA: trypsin-like peptidase domain-containing protein [Caldisericia bacterium]|nr:MAG: putative serine protease HtrA [bacterium ADurb.Bin132]HNY60612.1 trypsin-like peptidase domain-containing protein [Caldisericia bacterium]HOC79262.1 trypsin-like peptidase domain-containing protein [Caldisericia bacterium]HOG70062.1 trypsin-like peptidase domain-containing protein [Caldisericia bacterium]HPA65030.1 trypsin-like peptidase domain-containing protein [Caldisericia bacterium]